jgi:hypothetical protein
MIRSLLGVVVLGICVSVGIPSVAHASCGFQDLDVICSRLKDEKTGKAENSNTPPVSCESGIKHSVTLSWKASASLSTSHVEGEGYSLYRWMDGGTCMKIKQLVEHPFYEDCYVDAGKKYRYAVTAVKQSCESEPSNVVEALIPEP